MYFLNGPLSFLYFSYISFILISLVLVTGYFYFFIIKKIQFADINVWFKLPILTEIPSESIKYTYKDTERHPYSTH